MFSRKAGRPSNAMAGDVEERIFDAATVIFLRNGFGGASLDRIAEAAGASKATVYSRFSGKEALFSEVVRRNCERCLQMAYHRQHGVSLAEQLISVTQAIVTRLLSDEVLGLIRMVMAEAPRFPSLAKLTRNAGRAQAIQGVAWMIVEHAASVGLGALPATEGHAAHALATQVLDAVVSPMLMRALMHEDVDVVRGDVSRHVERTIGTYAAAGALDDF
ncbi:TetR/AcrR family transcriptional regulator [Robbsia sp. KACC 23696]|uniref:TetR/AcrR family transcriptional regulator n=1 Tax=Robbsia sp. KACC 23696 TaxID=3149231 RepID=UPI00325C278C